MFCAQDYPRTAYTRPKHTQTNKNNQTNTALVVNITEDNEEMLGFFAGADTILGMTLRLLQRNMSH